MSDSTGKNLLSAFSTGWSEIAPALFGRSSSLSLIALREVSGDGMPGALAVATTFSCAFAVSCAGAASGVLIALFKSTDADEIDRRVKQPLDGAPKPGGRAVVAAALEAASTHLATTMPAPVTFGPVTHIDLSGGESRLAAIVSTSVCVGTCSLSIGDDTSAQSLLLYSPHGSLQAANFAGELNSHSPAEQFQANGMFGQLREAAPPRNIERLLDIELDIVVRFGVTSVPLREVVRMGTGTMIELNRAVDEPVELLVNGRYLARGEVVVVDGYYGVRITEIGAPVERPLSLL